MLVFYVMCATQKDLNDSKLIMLKRKNPENLHK